MARACVSAAAGKFASEVEVLAMGQSECVPQGLYFFSVLLLQAGDLAGQGDIEGSLFVGRRRRCRDGTGLGRQQR
ncbi:hypothetical protein ACFU5O_28220 [Streptomyces sp. NPDC057445]|uniref:hypothetical protein n=1 Tax=Streptomyces sp. NPDC057445 TaxID=3346136 RepID=UPI0036B21038